MAKLSSNQYLLIVFVGVEVQVPEAAIRIGTEACSICQDDLTNPRQLPCVHTFCFDCLEAYCNSIGKLPGDDVPCPVCRTEFKIPKKGVADLPVKARAEERFPQPRAAMQQPGINHAPSGECQCK